MEGIGKKNVAAAFAMFCNCKESFSILNPAEICSCSSCKKIKTESHPDILFIRPSGKIIKIEDIRKAEEVLSLKPYEAKHRFIIIIDAHKLGVEAGNALLKEIEEPPAKTSFILIAHNMEDMLPTIASRCRHIRFSLISEEKIVSFIMKDYGLDKETANIIASMSDGSLNKVEALIDQDWNSKRKVILNEFLDLSDSSIIKILALAEIINEDKNIKELFWETIKSIIRDLALYKFSPENIINKDFTDKIGKASKNFNIKKLYEDFIYIETIENKLRFNINLRLAIENVLFKVCEKEC